MRSGKKIVMFGRVKMPSRECLSVNVQVKVNPFIKLLLLAVTIIPMIYYIRVRIIKFLSNRLCQIKVGSRQWECVSIPDCFVLNNREIV